MSKILPAWWIIFRSHSQLEIIPREYSIFTEQSRDTKILSSTHSEMWIFQKKLDETNFFEFGRKRTTLVTCSLQWLLRDVETMIVIRRKRDNHRWHFSFFVSFLFFFSFFFFSSPSVRHERILVNVYRAASFEEAGLIVKHTSVAFRLSTTWVKFNSSRAFSDRDNAFARTRRENQLFAEGANTPPLFSLRRLRELLWLQANILEESLSIPINLSTLINSTNHLPPPYLYLFMSECRKMGQDLTKCWHRILNWPRFFPFFKKFDLKIENRRITRQMDTIWWR